MSITVDGTALTYYRNVSYQKGINGVGESGISVSSLSFDTVAPLTADTAAPVAYDQISGIPFYINSRSRNGNSVHIECLDAAALLDQLLELSQQDITTVTDQSGKIVGQFVTAAVIQSKITAKCHGLTAAIPWTPDPDYGFPLSTVENKTFQQILTEISEVCAGFYTMTAAGLTFKYLNDCDVQEGRPEWAATYHSAVNVNGEFMYTAIKVDTSYEEATIGNAAAADFNTLEVSNSMSAYLFPVYDAVRTNYEMDPPTSEHYTYVDTSVIPEALDDIVGEITFIGWSCDNVILTGIPELADNIRFASGETLRLTELSIRWIGNTMLAAVGGTIPSGGEIGRRSRRQTEIDSKISLNTAYGCVRYNDYQLDLFEQAPSQGGGS